MLDRAACLAADATDPLRHLRERFALPDEVVYLDGNSLGALQSEVARRLREVVDHEWGVGLIRSWNQAGWVDLPQRVAARIAPLIGADADEVAVSDSTSANVFKAVAAARGLRPDRDVILTDDANFPTDVHVVQGLARLLGDTRVEVVPTDQIVDHLDERVAVLTLTHVDYRSGRRNDAAALTRAAHGVGALTVWDLSHSTGAVDVDVHAWGADLAVGCTYKYLSGGPGSPAYLYAAADLVDRLESPIQGWYGHAAPFDFDLHWRAAPGADRFMVGTPPVLSLSALDSALEIWDGMDLALVTAKARDLTRLCIDLVDARCGGQVVVATPRDATRRGGQVSLRHPAAHAITQALIDRGVVGDHRPPDVVRFGFAPLYVRFVDVWDAVDHLVDLLDSGAWDTPAFHRRRTVS